MYLKQMTISPTKQANLNHTNNSSTKPICYTMPSKIKKWYTTIDNGVNSLTENGTQKVVPYTSNMNVIWCKWVYRIKCHPNGTLERFKAHLVAKGDVWVIYL